MPRYLLSVHQPDGPVPPPDRLDRIMADVDAVDRAMVAAGARVLVAGLEPPAAARVLRPAGGDVVVTQGPYLDGPVHLGGFTVVEAPDLEAATAWGRRLAVATTLPIEVRALAGDD